MSHANTQPRPDVTPFGALIGSRETGHAGAFLMRVLLPILFIVVGCLPPARAEEPHTYWGKTVEGWLAVFRDTSSTEVQRRQAVQALGCFGAEAKAAVPDLVDAVRKGQFPEEAADALVQIGAGAEVTVPILIQRFLKRGCQHLTGMGSFPYDPSLENGLVRIGGPVVPALLEILNGPNRDLRVCAAEALGKIGPAARAAIPALIRALERPDRQGETPIPALTAIRALGRIGPEAKAAIPALNRLLHQRSARGFNIDFDVVIALDRIGAPPVQKLLDMFLRQGDPFVAKPLAWLGPKAREAVPALRAALMDHRRQVRFSAAVALAHIEPSATESVPVLIEALKHRDDEELNLRDVPGALARLGPKAQVALPTLIGLAKEGAAERDDLKALVQIDPEGVNCVPALIEALEYEDVEVADGAAKCLGLLGPRAKDAVPALAKAVTRDFHEDFYNIYYPQVSAAQALRRIGPPAKSAIPALIGALKYRHTIVGKEPDNSAAEAAARLLGSFGSDSKTAIPALIEAVRAREKDDANGNVRQAAILALGQIGPDAKVAIPVLRDLMRESVEESLYYPELVVALYQLAPDGKDIAERWLEKPMSDRIGPRMRRELECRALVLGAMGRTSIEGDGLIRHDLEWIDWLIANLDPRNRDQIEYLETWIEHLGCFGKGARLAIPRLNEFRKHPDPWVQMWAEEALERIVKAPPAEAD
jgi:HEAT repeat protein